MTALLRWGRPRLQRLACREESGLRRSRDELDIWGWLVSDLRA